MSPLTDMRSLRLMVMFACASTALVLGTPSALALPANGGSNYTQILCANPATETGLGLSGMPEGLTNPASLVNWQITVALVDCGNGRITPSRGVPMLVGQTNTYAQGTWSALLYDAPTNATINGGTIYRAERAEGPNNGFMGIIQQGGDYTNLYALPRNSVDQGDWYVGNVAARGTFSRPFAPENVVNLTISPDEKHWDVNATCDPNGNNNSSCTLNAGQWEYRIFGGEISLKADNDPQVSAISGPLTTESTLRGVESMTFSATDQGPGLAYVKVIVDGSTVQSQTIDTNDGRCVSIPGRDAYTWAYQVPCKTSVGGRTYSVNTALIPDGSHHLQVVIEDAAGNKSIALDRTVNVSNATNALLGAPLGSGASSASIIQGSPNGIAASETAQLRLGSRRYITRPFAKRALRLTGRLVNAQGHPIGGANLDITQKASGSDHFQIISHPRTRMDGSFSVRVPAGPSRLISVAYRAFSNDPTYAAQASVRESVQAGVQLGITPRRTSSTGIILLSGHVEGPVPKQGVIVDLLVHYRGRWEPFRTPRTDGAGRFDVAYQFQGALGQYPFRAEVPASQADFAFARGTSEVVDVSTN
jgi:hypothetical protein